MKKRLKVAKDVTYGDRIKITGYIFEVDTVEVTPGGIRIELWCWASNRKRITLEFSDPQFPVTVR